MNMSMSMSTIILKLYKPGLRKSMIIDEAMLNYSRAYQYLLDKAEAQIEAIVEKYMNDKGKYSAIDIVKWIDGKLSKELNEFCIEPFKDSIKIDFAAMLTGYLNLKTIDKFANFPSVYATDETLEKEYDKIMSEYMELGEFSYDIEEKIKKITFKSGILRSLFFCRYSINRNYSLLYNPENDRYYAKIYLMNVKNEKRKKLVAFPGKVLIYIDKKRELFKEGLNKKCFILFPLSFGKWQEKYLKEAIQNPEIIRTARLTKRKNEYFLSINIAREIQETIKTVSYMGVCRGIENVINYTIVDGMGNLLFMGSQKTDNVNIGINKIHEMANFLVKIARESKCQVIMEKLDKGDGLIWRDKDDRNYIPIMDVSKYNQLTKILDYKLPNSGLPSTIKVSGINIFCTCPNCGINSKANRFSNKILICIACGMTMDIENAGSLNLARRLIKYKNDKIIINVENTRYGLKFTNKELEFEFYPENPYDCVEEFMEKIDKTIKGFYDNINMESRKANFKKKLSLIKKIEGHRDIFELITID